MRAPERLLLKLPLTSPVPILSENNKTGTSLNPAAPRRELRTRLTGPTCEVSSQTMKAVVFGTGGTARKRVRALSRIQGVELRGVVSRTPEKAERLELPEGALVYSRPEEALGDDETDAVFICLPNRLHYDLARRSLMAGKHVCVEYPVALSVEEAKDLRRTAEEKDGALMVGNTMKYDVRLSLILARKDRLGKLLGGFGVVAFKGRGKTHWWLDRDLSGSIFAFYHYHYVEYARRIFGPVRWVDASDDSIPGEGSFNKVGAGSVLLGFDGASFAIFWYIGVEGRYIRFLVVGEEGLCDVIDEGKDVILSGVEPVRTPADEFSSFLANTEEFIRSCRGELDWREGFEWDLRTLEVSLAAEAAASERRRAEV